jgi:ribosomal protein S18 acetylase RimI-like enzyme
MKTESLRVNDIELVYDFLNNDNMSGIHKPSYYTISSIIHLYSEICAVVRETNRISAVSLNCPSLDGQGVYIYTFAVDKNLQRNGVGCSLFNFMADKFSQLNYKKICLRVLESNKVALHFWLAMGFKEHSDFKMPYDEIFSEIYLERSL